MTVLGLHVEQTRALIWGDSATIAAGGGLVRTGDCAKLVCNSLIPAVLVAAGSGSVARVAGVALLDACDYDEAIDAMPGALRGARAQLSVAAASNYAGMSTVAIVGYSRRYGRMIGHVITAPGFDVDRVAVFAQPEVDGLYSVESEEDAHGIGIEQVAALRRDYLSYDGGTLSVATVTARGITVRAVGKLGSA